MIHKEVSSLNNHQRYINLFFLTFRWEIPVVLYRIIKYKPNIVKHILNFNAVIQWNKFYFRFFMYVILDLVGNNSNNFFLSQYLTNLMHKICFTIRFYFMPLHVSSTCAHHQEVKIALHILCYHHTYRCDDGCVMQFWPPDDEHICSKHVEAWNKLIVKQKFCASSWLNTEINILTCTVSKTSKNNNNIANCIFYLLKEK